MARGTKRIKVDHDTTAAYAASQPLFDALRLAVHNTEEQRANLSNARDTVQRSHVKLAESIADGDGIKRSSYADSVVKAWRSATASYTEIFNALAKASAAVPSEGKVAREGHESFVKMASMANEANKVAQSYVLSEVKLQDSLEENVQHQGEEESEGPSSASGAGKDAVDEDVSMESIRLETAANPTPVKRSNIDSRKTNQERRMKEKKQRHEKKLLALRAKMRNKDAPNGAHATPIASQGPPAGSGAVEYEDVSGEVEARLKAKEAKREAAKKEKKRKRGSGDSLEIGIQGEGGQVRKPTKKSKVDDGRDESNIIAVKEKHGKKSRPADPADDDVGSGRKLKKAKVKR